MNSFTNMMDTYQVADSLYPGIELSNKTKRERGKVKKGLDNFSYFNWRGYNSFDNFGAFIIANKNSTGVKFLNGPNFSNEYTNPQYTNNGGSLQGIALKTKSISFNVGVYWISINDYRRFIDWLNPYEINTLSFSFNPKYFYQVKLAQIADSDRVFIGYDENRESMYYTELKLTFDIQGETCARGINPIEFTNMIDLDNNELKSIKIQNNSIWAYRDFKFLERANNVFERDWEKPDLLTPFVENIRLKLDIPENNTYIQDNTSFFNDLKLNIKSYFGCLEKDASGNLTTNAQKSKLLFDVTFKNLSFGAGNFLNIRYLSESGILLLKYGDMEYQILSLLNTVDSGEKIVDYQQVNKFFLPGDFYTAHFYDYIPDENELERYRFFIVISFYNDNVTLGDENFTTFITSLIGENFDNIFTGLNRDFSIECNPRTNLI